MALNTSAAYATYPDNVPLTGVLQALEQAGFEKEGICLLLSPTHPIATVVRHSSTSLFEQNSNAVTAGLIKWLSEFGAVVIPTFGFFIRSRAFFQALVTERSGAIQCGPGGALASLGFSDEDSRRFDGEVREGKALLYVSSRESAHTKWALELLRASGAEQAGFLESETAVGTAA